MAAAALAIVLLNAVAGDLAENQEIIDYVDETLEDVDVSALSDDEVASLYANRVAFNFVALIPCIASLVIDTKIYGSPRPMAYVFDWFLGGAVPIALAIIAAFVEPTARDVLIGTALGVYGATRVAILFVINGHITTFNDEMARRLAELRPHGPTVMLVFGLGVR